MNQRERESEGPVNATDLLLGPALARGMGGQTALIEDRRALSYDQLDALSNRYGNALRARGVERENRVLFMCCDSIDMVAAYLGAMRIGAVAVAFNVRAAPGDLLFAIRDSHCKALFIDARFLPVYEQIAAEVEFDLNLVVCDGDVPGRDSVEQWLDGCSETLDSEPMSPDDMAFWIYTSGTTGKPKAAVHLQRDVTLSELHLTRNLGLRPGERVFCSSKLFFAYALAHAFFGALRAGATSILFAGWPEPAEIADIVRRHAPDLVFSVPTFYRNMLRDGMVSADAFARVRHFVSAGEKLPDLVYDQWLQITGKPILEGLGTSETVYLYIANTPAEHRRGATGRLLPWAEARLVDDQGRAVEDPDTPGTAWLRMASVCDRYWNRQEHSRRTFEGFWYCTGDVFTRDAEGWWYHQGRGDDMLKISGQWVSPMEIENAVLQVDGVRDAAVVGVANADGLVRAVLFVVAGGGEGERGVGDRIRAQLQGRLSIYKCPRTIHLVEEIPRTATGKVQRFKLRRIAEAAGRG